MWSEITWLTESMEFFVVYWVWVNWKRSLSSARLTVSIWKCVSGRWNDSCQFMSLCNMIWLFECHDTVAMKTISKLFRISHPIHIIRFALILSVVVCFHICRGCADMKSIIYLVVRHKLQKKGKFRDAIRFTLREDSFQMFHNNNWRNVWRCYRIRTQENCSDHWSVMPSYELCHDGGTVCSECLPFADSLKQVAPKKNLGTAYESVSMCQYNGNCNQKLRIHETEKQGHFKAERCTSSTSHTFGTKPVADSRSICDNDGWFRFVWNIWLGNDWHTPWH